MGLTIRANNGKCPIEFDMGYGSFYRLRTAIGEKLAGSTYITWLATNEHTPKALLHTYCVALLEAIGEATYNFLVQSDGDGELSYKECKEVYEQIKDMKVDGLFGYCWCARPFTDFKELLKYCYSHRTKLIWF